MRACLHRASALPAWNGVFALPGLPALAAKSRGDHPCRKAAEQRDFTGPSLLLMRKSWSMVLRSPLVQVALWLRARREREQRRVTHR
jgi:hypothetical protein